MCQCKSCHEKQVYEAKEKEIHSCPLTKHDGQHLSGLLLPRVHAPEARVVDLKMRHRPQQRMRSSIGQLLHLAAQPHWALTMLLLFAVFLCPLLFSPAILFLLLPFLAPLLLQLQLGAAARGVAHAAEVLCVYWWQHRVLHWTRLWPLAPQAPGEEARLGGSARLNALLQAGRRQTVGFSWQRCSDRAIKATMLKYQMTGAWRQ